jgi:hypothetical protein
LSDIHRAQVAAILVRDFQRLPVRPRTRREVVRAIYRQTGRPVDVQLAELVHARLRDAAVTR